MKKTVQHFFLTIVIYLCACICTLLFVMPYSFTSFIGPAAGITTALIIAFGAGVFSAIAVATILFCAYLFFWMNLPVELSMVIITLLAILLQGYWAKQLTLNETNQYNWLKSRRYLLLFLFKIGPLISLVSAFSVMIVVILENKTLDENLFFTFVSGWSGSVLFAIFITPILLLTQGHQQLNLPKRTFIIIASFFAFVVIGLLFKISQNVQQHERQDTFKQVKTKVIQQIQNEIDITIDELNSLLALFKARKGVELREFNVFAQQIFQTKSSVRVLEWAPITYHEDRDSFERNNSVILEKSISGIVQKAGDRNRYAPIRFIYPYLGNEPILGLDVLTNPNSTISMDNVINSQNIIASAPINLIQDNHANVGGLFIAAVFSDSTANIANTGQESSGDLLGFVIAVVQFNDFFQQISPLITDNVDMLIEDITSPEPFILFGRQSEESYRHVDTVNLQINSRQWRVTLSEHQAWQLQQKSWHAWGILFGSTLAGMLFQVLILMMAVYSNELSAQIVRKTRELIIAKDQSERKSKAKTDFLYTLTRELQTPLQAVRDFCQQLPKSNSKEKNKIIKNIELAQGNMQKLLHMVVDLSKIELGESHVNNTPLDFYGFLGRIDDMLSVKMLSKELLIPQEKKSITFLIDSSVPHFINSDELRIQQLLIALCESVHELFNSRQMRLTVKVHSHHLSSATLLFVFTSHDDKPADNAAPFSHFINTSMVLFNTQLAMAQEVCQLMNGDANLAISDSGERVLTASIKISITPPEQQHAYQSHVFDETDEKK
jgi:CHASE1-domain containing sensor protein